MSGQNDYSHYVPTEIDTKPKFLMFDQDLMVGAFLIFIAGFAFGFPIVGLICAIMLLLSFNKVKAGLHENYMLHLFYWVGNSPKLKEVPESYNRQFFG